MSGNDAGSAAKRPLAPLRFYLLAVLIGGVSTLGALFFRALIGLVHNLFFLGKLSPYYDASVHTPASPWGAAVILVPVLGGVGVAFLVLGALLGVASALYIKSIYAFEGFFERLIPRNYYLRHSLGMLLSGALTAGICA